ncbi:MAG: hypothetical protein AAF658_14255, partial [Myxococcota bacterium]
MRIGSTLERGGGHAALVVFAMGALSLSCNDSVVAESTGLSFGEACAEGDPCISPLSCIDSTCQPTGEAEQGQACIVGGDCTDGLACEQGFCVPQGMTPSGALCGTSADCQEGLRCNLPELGALPVCQSAGDRYLGERCQSSTECLDGLVCDPSASECLTQFSAPFGTPCANDAECDLANNVVCLSTG